MAQQLDRTKLSLSLSPTTSVDDESSKQKTKKQPKLMKSISSPPSYSVRPSLILRLNSVPVAPHTRVQFTRAQSIRESISVSTAKFFGVPPATSRHSPESNIVHEKRWNSRRIRYIQKRYGSLNEDAVAKKFIMQSANVTPSPGSIPTLKAVGDDAQINAKDIEDIPSRSSSVDARIKRLERRDSVLQITYNRLSSFLQRGSMKNSKACAVKRDRSTSGSFSPFSVQSTAATVSPSLDIQKPTEDIVAPEIIQHIRNSKSPESNKSYKNQKIMGEELMKSPSLKIVSGMSTVIEVDDEATKDDEPSSAASRSLPQKDSVCQSKFSTTYQSKSPKYIARATVAKDIGVDESTFTADDRWNQQNKRTHFFREKRLWPMSSSESIQDEVFFDVTPLTDKSIVDTDEDEIAETSSGSRPYTRVDREICEEKDEAQNKGDQRRQRRSQTGRSLLRQKSFDASSQTPVNVQSRLCFQKPLKADYIENAEPEALLQKKMHFLDQVRDKLMSHKHNSPHPRSFGLGFGIWRKIFDRKYKSDAENFNFDTFLDYRPFFTYWVTTVQILVTIISILSYGIGPWGFGRSERTGDVLHSSVTLKHVGIYEQENFWIGPKFDDLVRLGAKFVPCMRKDPRIFAQIENDRRKENETGCCIYNDGTGCFQTSEGTCPSLIATLFKWKPLELGPYGRLSGAVCGQDPRYCEDPASVEPYEWPDDITEWPICKETTHLIPENEKHMLCEITGRPCCIQLHGQCRITTRDYCDFVHGHFHENATLCSQVSCLGEVCGMLPFLRRDRPDQWYRLFIPLFLHAGILHCALTVFIQIFYMRDLEKMLGWARVAFLYIGAGVGGYLASSIFVPYKPEVGPAGSHVGMFAAMFTDVVYSWNLLARPWHAILQLSSFLIILFFIGTFSWVDNWAHLFGFIFGFLISLAVLPYIQVRKGSDGTHRLVIVTLSLALAIGLYALLFFILYWLPALDCQYCEYFNCIPYTDHFCDNQGLRLQSWLPI